MIDVRRETVDTMKLLLDTIKDHYTEVPFIDRDMEFDLDEELYRTLEATGLLLNLVAYLEGRPVGYLIAVCSPMLHFKGKWEARTDGFYVAPQARKLGVFDALLDKYHTYCKENGVSVVFVNANETFPLTSDILTCKGYVLSDRSYKLME
jgi:GNAT superfamily N-acetyltransferase